MKNTKQAKSKLFSLKYLFYDFTKISAFLPGLIWFRPKFIYENEKAKKKIRGGALVIANHCTFYDPVYLMSAIWYRRHHFVCLKQFFMSKAGWLFKLFLCIPIDTGNFGFGSFHEIVEHLQAGELVSLYPEGHVNVEDTSIKAFKSGVVLMSLKGKSPIVPVYIEPKKHFYNRLKAVIGEPVDIVALYGEKPSFAQVEEIAKLLKEKEENLKNYIKEN